MKRFLFTVAVTLVLAANGRGQITSALPGRSIIKLLPDYIRPYVYALNQANGSVPGTLLALNATNGSIAGEISLNLYPTDMAMSPAGDAIYVINGGSRTISKVDLNTFTVASQQTITTPNAYNQSNPLHIAVGRSNLVYFTDGGWAPSITTFDYANGTNVAVYDDGNGAGGIQVTRDGKTLYRWRQYGWGAGNVNSWVTRYDAYTNSNLTPLEDSFTSWRRDPTDTPIFLDGAERWVFNKQQMFNATNVSILVNQFSDNLYGISLDGSVAFGPTEVYNTQNGNTLTNLPFSTTVQTLSGDQTKLFRYNPATTNVVIYDMTSIAPLSGPSLAPMPANGSVVSLPLTNLNWTVSPYALAYDVYLGTNPVQVASATQASAQYLGRDTAPGQSLTLPLVPGTIYYWRVDVVGFNATNTGSVWSFTASTLSINPSQINYSAIAGYNPPVMSLSLTSAAPVAWSAAVTGSNWMTLGASSGTSPDAVTIHYNTALLPPGLYTNNIEFSIGALKMEVPVTLNIKPLNIVKLLADQQRPYIYGLQAPALSGQSGLLLFINATNGNIDKTLTIGINPVDLTINYGEGRLYIASWGEDATYVVDLASQTLLPSLQLGTDVYKINAGKPGQIITEGEDQWITVSLINTTNGTTITSGSFREGDGEFDPTGRYYYHGDYNISGAGITKYDMSANTFTSVTGAGGEYYYGSRNVVMSPDGSRIFWTGAAYDANLNNLGNLGEEIYATTAHGDLALGQQHVFNSHNGQTLYTWPFTSTVMAVSGDQKNVFLYNSTSNQLVMIPMSSIATVPGPGLNPTPADGAVINPPLPQVSWTVSPLALSYQVYMGTNAAAVASAGTNSALYLGTTSSNAFSLPVAVNPGTTYYWRVDSVGFSGVTPGAVWSFTVSALTITPQTLSLSGVTGLPILPQSISLSAPLPASWNLTVAQPWLTASVNSGTTPSSVTLSFNTTNLAAGLYTNQLTVTANGITLQLPVTLQLFDLNASKMVADPNRDMIYVLHPGSGSFADAFLLFLNTDTGVVEKVIPIGTNPTDLAVNRFEDRLYVSNWQQNQTRVVDLKTRTELTPLALGTDIYKINGARAGRIITEGEDQWIAVNLVDTASGAVAGNFPYPQREGDGETDPTGTVYYHCDNNISDAHVHKFICTNDTPVEVAGGNQHEFGTRNLVLSADGNRVFWNSYLYDTNLNELGGLGTEIYACSTNGAVAFGAQQAFDTTTMQAIYNLPVASGVEAVDRLNQRLWYFDASTHRIESLALATLEMPGITQQPAASTSVGAGANVNLTVTAMGLNPLSYQWQMQGTNLVNQTNYFLALNNIQGWQQGNYQVIVSNPYGAVTSAVAQVSVLYAPAIVSQPAGTNVPAGQSFSLSVTANGSTPLTYEWFFQNTAISTSTNATLTIANAQAGNEGIYSVVVANAAGSVTSSVVMVRITPAGPAILSGPASVLVSASSNATFSVTATGSQPMSYQWLFNGNPVSGATASQYSLTDVQSWNAGGYQVVIANSAGSVTSLLATLTVTPVAPYFVQQPLGASLPAGTNLTLTALAQGSEPIGYQWIHDGVQVSGAYQTSLTLTNLAVTNGGNYALVAFNTAGVSTSLVASVTVTAAPPVFVQQPASASVLVGQPIALNSLATGSAPMQYQWYFNNNPLAGQTNNQYSSFASLGSAGSYFVIATNNYGSATSVVAQVTVNQPATLLQLLTNQIVNAGDPVTLTVSAAGTGTLSYNWSQNGQAIAGNGATLAITNIQPAQSGYYQVMVTNQFGLALSSCRVSVFGPPARVIAWGDDSGGQTDVPTNLDDVVMAAGGDYHSLALRHDGSLAAWGYNGDGQTTLPTNAGPFVSIAAGANHNLAITESGTVVAWGRNDAGQCNVPATVHSALAVAAGNAHSLALLNSGIVAAWGDDTFGQTDIPSALQPGGYWLQVNGYLWTWVPVNPPPVRAIAAGRNHSLALMLQGGTVVGWGDDAYGQTSVPAGLSNVVAIAAGYLHSVALCSNGTVVAWGDNTFGQTNVPAGLSNVVAIAAGDFDALALRADGTVVGWGDDSYGQTNVPTTVNGAIAVGSGDYHGLALVPFIPSLAAQITGTGMTIQWQGAGVLQWAPSPAGPFTDVPCQGTCYTNLDMSSPAKFFRLRR